MPPSAEKPDRRMLDILVCPLTKAPLRYDDKAGELISTAAKLAYPVRGGVAILLPSEARLLADDEPVPADETGAALRNGPP
ncbi:Trm112 family protein [Notoacmeibacter sp. MSK16QG-6]|uniref:Trm112 family protein n=1 Tax=Notoacmeibacter sp. MSK16QG-6 TaxID=2957982 RepID=UPI0020A0D3AF|nr:Trm112 family protein [Notoacmeibacter sp. MSK16QG-6]MCP1199125.1 Trm112 family protein [Notoacmeibacter sp. MSK16QG-6]